MAKTKPQLRKCSVCGEEKYPTLFTKANPSVCRKCADNAKNQRVKGNCTPDDGGWITARLVKSGELVKVTPIDEWISYHKHTYKTLDGRIIPQQDIELSPSIDWEQRRFEAALSIFNGILSNITLTNYPHDRHISNAARHAVIAADEFIREFMLNTDNIKNR